MRIKSSVNINFSSICKQKSHWMKANISVNLKKKLMDISDEKFNECKWNSSRL